MATCVRSVDGGIAVGEGLGTVLAVATGSARDVGTNLEVPTPPPPQPAKDNTMRDKQVSERIPENQNEGWRRIDYLSATKGQQLWGCGALNYNQLPENVYRFDR
jgi:hypothetical protein